MGKIIKLEDKTIQPPWLKKKIEMVKCDLIWHPTKSIAKCNLKEVGCGQRWTQMYIPQEITIQFYTCIPHHHPSEKKKKKKKKKEKELRLEEATKSWAHVLTISCLIYSTLLGHDSNFEIMIREMSLDNQSFDWL